MKDMMQDNQVSVINVIEKVQIWQLLDINVILRVKWIQMYAF